MTPHKQCISRLQEILGCACVGDCICEGLGTLSTKPELKKISDVFTQELDEFLGNFSVIANNDILYRKNIAEHLMKKYIILKR